MTIIPEKKNFEQDIIPAPDGKEVKITFLQHASLLLEYNGLHIYSDPVSNFDDCTIDYTKLPQADLILVSHDHYDHLDLAAIDDILSPDTKIVCNPTSAEKIENATVMKNGDTLKILSNIDIEAVAAYNITEGHLQFHPRHRDNGYILTQGGLRIYIAGDTEDTPDAYSIKNIDVAFLPVNQPYTMTLEQASKLARGIAPAILYPYHYTDTDIAQLPKLLSNTNIDVRLRQMP